MDVWARRAEVSKLLARGTRSKLAGDALPARDLERAYRLAHEPSALHAPWPALTAYRLAHALLGSAADSPALGRIASLFDEATAFGHLGPWPHVFRLAALHRLGAPPDEQRAVFDRAAAAYVSWSAREARNPDGGLAGIPVRTARDDLYNLLDLAGLFVGADRSALRGRGLRLDFVDSDGPYWVLTNTAPALASLAGPLARAEADALGAQYPAAIRFELPAHGPPHWRTATGGVSKSGAGEMRLLASLLLRDAGSVEVQAQRATGRDGSSAVTTVRQLRRRLRDRLVAAGHEVAAADLTAVDDNGRIHFAGEAPLIGVISERRYSSGEPE